MEEVGGSSPSWPTTRFPRSAGVRARPRRSGQTARAAGWSPNGCLAVVPSGSAVVQWVDFHDLAKLVTVVPVHLAPPDGPSLLRA